MIVAAIIAIVVLGAVVLMLGYWRDQRSDFRAAVRALADSAAHTEQVAAGVAVLGEKTSALIVGVGDITGEKLDVIHALVNSNMTNAMQAELDATRRELALMREVVRLHRAAGQEPTMETHEAIARTERRVGELEIILRDRRADQERVDKRIDEDPEPDAV